MKTQVKFREIFLRRKSKRYFLVYLRLAVLALALLGGRASAEARGRSGRRTAWTEDAAAKYNYLLFVVCCVLEVKKNLWENNNTFFLNTGEIRLLEWKEEEEDVWAKTKPDNIYVSTYFSTQNTFCCSISFLHVQRGHFSKRSLCFNPESVSRIRNLFSY